MPPRKRINIDINAIKFVTADSDSDSSLCSESHVSSDYDTDSDNTVLTDPDLREPKQRRDIQNKHSFDWKRPTAQDKAEIHDFKGKNTGRSTERRPPPKDSLAYDFFKLYFTDEFLNIITRETNKYAQQLVANVEFRRRSRMAEFRYVDVRELELFLAIFMLMGHKIQDKVADYWSTNELFYSPIFGKMMPRDRFTKISGFLHFSDNSQKKAYYGLEYDPLWKFRECFEYLRKRYQRLYSPSEYLSINEMTVKFKGRTIFKHYVPKKRLRSGLKVYKLCDGDGYVSNLNVYLGENKNYSNAGLIHSFVTEMTERVTSVGHKLFLDNKFSSPELYSNLWEKGINCFGTVTPSQKSMPKEFAFPDLKLKSGEVRARHAKGLTAFCWKANRKILHLLSNMHHPPLPQSEERPQIVQDYNEHLVFLDNLDQVANAYTACRKTSKWVNKLFFHLLDLSVMNAHIVMKAQGYDISLAKFRLDVIAHIFHKNKVYTVGRVLAVSGPGKDRLSNMNNEHWIEHNSTRRRCAVCSHRKMHKTSTYYCGKCDVGLCVTPCFREYHTLENLPIDHQSSEILRIQDMHAISSGCKEAKKQIRPRKAAIVDVIIKATSPSKPVPDKPSVDSSQRSSLMATSYFDMTCEVDSDNSGDRDSEDDSGNLDTHYDQVDYSGDQDTQYQFEELITIETPDDDQLVHIKSET